MEEISITLVNSLVFSAIVFFPLKLTGDFVIFWLIFLTTTSIGIGETAQSPTSTSTSVDSFSAAKLPWALSVLNGIAERLPGLVRPCMC